MLFDIPKLEAQTRKILHVCAHTYSLSKSKNIFQKAVDNTVSTVQISEVLQQPK